MNVSITDYQLKMHISLMLHVQDMHVITLNVSALYG